MKEKQIKINNSYESEISNSGSSSVEESTYENRSFDGTIPKLQEIFKPQYIKIENINDSDVVEEGKVNPPGVKTSDNVINSSQESDFLGFTEEKDEMNYMLNKIRSTDMTLLPSPDGDKRRKEFTTIYNSSQESIFLGFPSDKKKDNIRVISISQESDFNGFSDDPIDNTPLDVIHEEESVSEISHQSNNHSHKCCNSIIKLPTELEEKSYTKSSGATGIYEMINAENSCNAVDIKLSNEVGNFAPVTKLSFDGTIKIRKSLDNKETNKIVLQLEGESSQAYKYVNETSPDIFDDDSDYEGDDDDPAAADDGDNESEVKGSSKNIQDSFNQSIDETSLINDVRKKERELLTRIQKSLSGIPPPPSVTSIELNMFNVINANKKKFLEFMDNRETITNIVNEDKKEIIFKPTHSVTETKNMKWPDILNVRNHGICYNISTDSEKIELLCLSVLDRCVGMETKSSYQTSPSSAKKRNMRSKMLAQSPGNRLSHLARRRAIFSSANLQSSSQNNIGGKQILLNSKNSNNRQKKVLTPKRRTPGKQKNARKSPSSSTKKRLFFRAEQISIAPSRETSKRALFQSPPQQQQQQQQQQRIILKPQIKPEIANRVEKSKRALFSPEKPTNFINPTENYFNENYSKRGREDDDVLGNSSKFLRMDSLINTENITPRSLKIKSQSFCVGTGARNNCSSLDTITGKSLFRTNSDTTFCSSQLSESHKKKLLWAVSEALRCKQITVKHQNFKQYASVLARVVKRLFQGHCQKSSSTSDTLLRLAKKQVFWVMQGKTADEIYVQEKNRMEQEKLPKIIGYIAPEDYENRKILSKKYSQNSLFSENSMDSFNLSQTFGGTGGSIGGVYCHGTQSSQISEFSSSYQISQDSLLTKCPPSAMKLPIQPNSSLQNSSSKNNLSGSALRENIDCELRRSAQKNFTGKDQKNLSPYIDKINSNSKKYSSNNYEMNNTMKVKRQISFDS